MQLIYISSQTSITGVLNVNGTSGTVEPVQRTCKAVCLTGTAAAVYIFFPIQFQFSSEYLSVVLHGWGTSDHLLFVFLTKMWLKCWDSQTSSMNFKDQSVFWGLSKKQYFLSQCPN